MYALLCDPTGWGIFCSRWASCGSLDVELMAGLVFLLPWVMVHVITSDVQFRVNLNRSLGPYKLSTTLFNEGRHRRPIITSGASESGEICVRKRKTLYVRCTLTIHECQQYYDPALLCLGQHWICCASCQRFIFLMFYLLHCNIRRLTKKKSLALIFLWYRAFLTCMLAVDFSLVIATSLHL